MPESPDQTVAAELFRRSMQDALANLDKVNADLLIEKEKAIDEQIAAREKHQQIERDAHTISEAYIEKHRKDFEERLKKEILLEVVRKLIVQEIPSVKLKEWLDLTPDLLADAWMYIGFEKLDDQHVGHVAYDGTVRAGKVIFYRDDLTIHFPYEMGGGNTLVYLNVPSPQHWNAETGTSTEQRMPILEFVAKRIIRDQAPSYAYKITDDSITIFK